MLRWVIEEMEGLALMDERLNRRATMMLNSLAGVAESTPDAVRTKAELDGIYRLMDNKKVTHEALLEPHLRKSITRLDQHPRVLLVDDTTEIDLTKPSRQVDGAGPLSSNSNNGFYIHPLMAYLPSGVPLGLVDCILWSRTSIDTNSTASQKRTKRMALPIEEKESYRWLQMTRKGISIAREHPETQCLSVSDSEADIYEVLAEIIDRPDNYHLLVRGCQNRAINECELPSGDEGKNSHQTIRAALEAAPLCFKTSIAVSARTARTQIENRKRRLPREKHNASVEVRAVRLTLRAPYRKDRKLPPVSCNIVEVREVNSNAPETSVNWTLITTLPINDEEAIREIIEAYKVRWNIEIYFRILKSGMKIEKLQYRTLSRYLKAIIPLMIVAWRVQMVTHAARETPDASCDLFFDKDQWQPLFLVSHPKNNLPKNPPTIHEFLLMIAAIGGYIKKKAQGPPGTKTVWRGIQRLEMLTLAYNTFGQAP